MYRNQVTQNQNRIRDLLTERHTIQTQIANLEKPEGDKRGIEKQKNILQGEIDRQKKQGDLSAEELEVFNEAETKFKENSKVQELAENNLVNLKTLQETNIQLRVMLPNSNDSEFDGNLRKMSQEHETETNEKWQAKLCDLIREQIERREAAKSKCQTIQESDIFKKGQENIEKNKTLKSLTEALKKETANLE